MAWGPEPDGEALLSEDEPSGGVDEAAVDLGGLGVLMAAKLGGQEAVEGVGEQGQGEVEIDVDRNSRAQGVEVADVSPGLTAQEPMHEPLRLMVRPIVSGEESRWNALMAEHHCLGFRILVGEPLK